MVFFFLSKSSLSSQAERAVRQDQGRAGQGRAAGKAEKGNFANLILEGGWGERAWGGGGKGRGGAPSRQKAASFGPVSPTTRLEPPRSLKSACWRAPWELWGVLDRSG